MKYALVITGALAGLAIAAPDLVVLGYFLLIVPGLILTVAPTAFVYMASTALIRRLLPIASPVPARATAFGIALLLGWAVMQPFRLAALNAYRADELPDVLPSQAIKLDGHVRVERPNPHSEPDCDYMCLALLDSPHVRSVTTETSGRGKPSDSQRSAAYALVAAKSDPEAGIFPSQPGQIVREYPPLAQANREMKLIKAAKAVEANWAVRLAGHERLREAVPVDAESADWVIRFENHTSYRTSTLRRVTILDSAGTVRFRKSYRKQAVPARIFYLGFHAGIFAGPIKGSFHIGRQSLESGLRSLKLESELLQAIEFRVPKCDANATEELRNQAIQALDDPTATSARLDLARRYLGLFFFDSKDRDHALIARIVADGRVRDIDTQIKNVFSKDKTPAMMRAAYVSRICMDHTSASLRHWLAARLASFPAGTFSAPEASYLSIWTSPELTHEAAPLIATLADLGSDQALPQLDSILDTALQLPNYRERRSMIEGIRAAYVRLGPQASSAAPRIRELFLRRPSPIMTSASDADQWRFALARMGVALTDLPVFPNQSPQSIERNQRQVANKLERYARDHSREDGK